MKILDLPLKSTWYLMIELGIKTEEYREIKPYWCQRLIDGHPQRPYWEHLQRDITKAEPITKHKFSDELRLFYKMADYTHVRFRYGNTKRPMLFELKEITIGKGNPEWGAPDYDVFILKLGERCNKVTKI